jgi:hypothetical protein
MRFGYSETEQRPSTSTARYTLAKKIKGQRMAALSLACET